MYSMHSFLILNVLDGLRRRVNEPMGISNDDPPCIPRHQYYLLLLVVVIVAVVVVVVVVPSLLSVQSMLLHFQKDSPTQ